GTAAPAHQLPERGRRDARPAQRRGAPGARRGRRRRVLRGRGHGARRRTAGTARRVGASAAAAGRCTARAEGRAGRGRAGGGRGRPGAVRGAYHRTASRRARYGRSADNTRPRGRRPWGGCRSTTARTPACQEVEEEVFMSTGPELS